MAVPACSRGACSAEQRMAPAEQAAPMSSLEVLPGRGLTENQDLLASGLSPPTQTDTQTHTDTHTHTLTDTHTHSHARCTHKIRCRHVAGTDTARSLRGKIPTVLGGGRGSHGSH